MHRFACYTHQILMPGRLKDPPFHLLYADTDPDIIPERQLCAALLGRAILDAYGSAVTDRQIRRNAKKWLFVPTAKTRAWSCAWVCDILDLDIEHLRTAIQDEAQILYLCSKLR